MAFFNMDIEKLVGWQLVYAGKGCSFLYLLIGIIVPLIVRFIYFKLKINVTIQ